MELLTVGESAVTPWAAFSPVWMVVVALFVPASVWVGLAWRRAFEEDPMRIRRAGVREMRRLLAGLRRSRSVPQSRHLHAWMRATARTWGVRVSAPTPAEVANACHSITGDASTVTRWRELWLVTERGLFAPNARAPEDWLERATTAALDVEMPKRERRFPDRLGHWVPSGPWVRSARWAPWGRSMRSKDWAPSVIAGVVVALAASVPGASRADVPMSGDDYAASATSVESAPPSAVDNGTEANVDGPSGQVASGANAGAGAGAAASSDSTPADSPTSATSSPEPLTHEQMIEAQKSARDALAKNWNDWAAHHNMAALGIETENWNIAIAYATASFLQHPSSAITRETLRVALEQTQTADERLRAMVSGAWYERIPSMSSASGWQRLSILSGVILAIALTVLVGSLYVSDGVNYKRRVVWASRAAAIAAVGALTLSVVGWNGYGLMSQPTAAILLENVNVSPAPTDLVPVNETSPAAAGSIVVTQRTFLGWQQIAVDGGASGWVRRNAVMAIYGGRT